MDLRVGELRKQGLKIRLQEQPFKILELLLAHRDEVVTRAYLREKLWPADTFVDFDHGLNKSIQKLREALGDTADNPRFIETLPRRGYRFIAPVSERASTSEPIGEVPTPPRASGLGGRVVIGLATLSALVLIGYLAREGFRRAEKQPDGKIRMVVLPFENLSGDAEQEYFSDGLTEEMIAQLGRLRPQRLGVIARTSAWQYKETEKNITQIGRELGVGYVLEGSVRKGPGRVRITAQLIQVSDQTHLWAKSYEHHLKDILIVQSEVARAIAGEIQLKLRPQDKEKLASVGSVDPEAYQAYLLGRYLAKGARR